MDSLFPSHLKSVGGQIWKLAAVDERHSLALAQRYDLPDSIARLLAMREVVLDEAEDYLEPRLRTLMPDPYCLTDMEQAVKRVAHALKTGEKIAIFGDYDVDGATSSAIILRYLRALGVEADVYIPDRVKEGYGPNREAFQTLKGRGAALIITVDCGTMALTPLQNARDMGVDVIVIDHHQTGTEMPPAYALINPRRPDDESGLGHLAAVGVVFMFLVGLNRYLDEINFLPSETAPDLLSLLDLVALGTVCDVVPLTGLNRAFVSQGIKIMQMRDNQGINALAQVARCKNDFGIYELGFQLGPRVNAGGRVGEATLGVRLLTTNDAEEAQGIAMRLNDFNQQRQQIETEVLSHALITLETALEGRNTPPPAIILGHENWHAGVIGIVASRLKDKYQRPCFIIAWDDKGEGKGSVRSLKGIDVGQIIARAVAKGIINGGGGHAMAAGVSLHKSQLDAFTAYLNEEIAPLIVHEPRDLVIEAALSPAGASRAFYDDMQRIGPFGAGNHEPRFMLPDVKIVRADIVGDGHVRCIISGAGKKSLKAIAFSSVAEEVRQFLQTHRSECHLAGYLRADDWQGRRDIQFMIHDAFALIGA